MSYAVTRPLTSGLTHGVTGGRLFGRLSNKRLKITGSGTAAWTLTYNGVDARTLGGYNLGEFDYYETANADTEIAALYALGVRHVRLVGFWRWFSDPAKGDADSRLDAAGAPRYTNPIHEAKLKAYARAVEKLSKAHPADPMFFTIVGEGDVLQSGTQTETVYAHAVSLVQGGEVIPGGFSTWHDAGGYNLFTSAFLRGVWLARWAWAALEFRSYDYCYGFEGLSEPLPGPGVWDPLSPYGTPGTSIYPPGYDSTWSSGSTTNHETVESLFRMFLTVVRALAPNTPCILGGRGGYNILPECQELVTALSNPAGLGGNWIAKNCLIFTFDHLDGGVIVPENTPIKYSQFLTMNVPAYMNQLGSRNDHDPNAYFINLAQSVCVAFGVGPVIWEYRANSANGYGPYWSNHDGPPMTFSSSATRLAANTARFAETLATLESAALAACTAEGAVLFTLKPDLSNCFAADNVTQLTLGSIVPGTTTLGKITATLDPLGTGLFFNATGTACPIVAYPWVDGSGNPQLPAKRLGLKFDGVNTFLSGSAIYWTDSVGDATMIAAARAASVTANQTLLAQTNNAGSTDRYRLSFGATHVPLAVWRGDDAIDHLLTGTTPQGANTPIVISSTKSGVAGSQVLTLFVNGLQEAQSTAQTVNTASQFTRLRIGATGNTPDLNGTVMGWAVSKTAMSDVHRLTIERYLGMLHGGGCKR